MHINRINSTLGTEFQLSDGTIFYASLTLPDEDVSARNLFLDYKLLIVDAKTEVPAVGDTCTDEFGRNYLLADDGQGALFRQFLAIEVNRELTWFRKTEGAIDPVTRLPNGSVYEEVPDKVLGLLEPETDKEGQLRIPVNQWRAIVAEDVHENDKLDNMIVVDTKSFRGVNVVTLTDGQ